MIDRSVAHYRITAAIGAGGMGRVYRATDTRLQRDVALKVPPPEMSESRERLERFRREARAVAARAVLEELRARPAASPTVASEAWLLGALGEIDAALDVLARAEEEGQGLLCYTGLPGLDPLRSKPRFAALLRRRELSG